MFDKVNEQLTSTRKSLQKKLIEAEHEEEALLIVSQNWIDGLPEPTRYVQQSDCLWLELEAETVNDALELVETINPERLYMIKDGWFRITSVHQFDEADFPDTPSDKFHRESQDRKASTSIHPYWLNSKQSFGKHEHVLNCYKYFGVVLCLVQIKIAEYNREDYHIRYRVSGGQGNCKTSYTQVHGVCNSGLFNKSRNTPRASQEYLPDIQFYYA